MKVRVRAATIADAQQFISLAILSTPHFEGRASPPIETESFRDYVRPAVAGLRHLYLVLDMSNDQLLGAVTINNILRGMHHCGTIGYWVGVPFQHSGVMTAALPLVLDDAFGTLRIHRLEANVESTNLWSKRLLERNGFLPEGQARELIRIQGVWKDHERWALLETDRRFRKDK